MDFDHSLHDAWIETVTIGPRREVRLALALGSARMSDPRLPDVAILRFGDIEDFEQVCEFFARFELEPDGRIDRLTVKQGCRSPYVITFEIDPQGAIEIECSKLDFIETDAV